MQGKPQQMLVEFTDAESRWLRSIRELVVAVPEDSVQDMGPLALGTQVCIF